MDLVTLQDLLDRIQGCTFASIDSVTFPKPGIRCETQGTRVILFTNKKVSGYDQMVRRRLLEAGRNPDDFVLGDLPWGERVPNSPLITCRGNYYLQTIVLAEGQSRYFILDAEINPDDFLPRRRTNQGLPRNDEVFVNTYKLDSIVRIALMGEVLIADAPARAILRIKP